jgi:hypothetical protein
MGMDTSKAPKAAEDSRQTAFDKITGLSNQYMKKYGYGPSEKKGGGGGGKKPPPGPARGQSSGGHKGGGGPPISPPGPKDWEPEGEMSMDIKQMAQDLMSGKMSRYNDKRVQDMKTQLHQSTFGKVQAMKRQAEADAAKRGIFRSGMSLRMGMDISRDAMKAYSAGVTDIMIKKMEAEFQDKIAGANMAQTWLTQKQNYELGKERNAIARAQIAATMAAARMSAKVGMASIRAANGRAAAALQGTMQRHADTMALNTFDRAPGINPEGVQRGGYQPLQ